MEVIKIGTKILELSKKHYTKEEIEIKRRTKNHYTETIKN